MRFPYVSFEFADMLLRLNSLSWERGI